MTVSALAVLLVGLLPPPAAKASSAPVADPCGELVSKARSLPDKAWARGFEPVTAWVRIDRPGAPVTREEKAIASRPDVLAALADDAGAWRVFVDHLARTSIYAAYDVQGTLHCQDLVFLRSTPGRPATIVPAPRSFGQGGLCWMDSANFGEVFGRPALIEHQALAVTSDREGLVVTPWTGRSWGATCRLTLRYKTSFALAEQFCGDAAVCRAAGRQALAIAVAYSRAPGKASAPGVFAFGPPPSAEDRARVGRIAKAVGTPDFPTFGETPRTAFPNFSGPTLFPLLLDGKPYVAAIGYGGFGWRQIGDTLLGVYQLDGDTLKPMAGFVVTRSLTGLASASTGGESGATD